MCEHLRRRAPGGATWRPVAPTIDIPSGGWRPGDRPLPTEGGPQFALTVFPAPARWASRGEFRELSWAEALEMVIQPELWPGAGGIDAALARLPAWSFARFRDDTRVVMRDEAAAARETALRVEAVHGLFVEYDDEPAIDGAHIANWWGDHAFLAYTTGFHEQARGEKPQGPRWRVLIPLHSPVTLEVAARLGQWARHSRRSVGIVAESTLDGARVTEVPAIGPGGYRWVGGLGRPLDPRVALLELARWAAEDVELRARDALAGTTIERTVERFLARHHQPVRHPIFPVPGSAAVPKPPTRSPVPTAAHPSWGPLAELLGVWPGRTMAVFGPAGSGRSAFVLQLAAEVARASHPVLMVLTRMGTDEVVARLLAARLDGVSSAELLQGAGAARDLDAHGRALATECSGLHIWSPPAGERTRDELFHRVRAVSDAHGGKPPLVVLDAVEGWAVDDPERGTREVVAALRDAAHGAVFGLDWPGAGVIEVSTSAPSASLRSADSLRQAWDRGELRALGPLADDVHLALVIATDPPGPAADAIRRATVVVARNRDGRCGAFELTFDARAGRFAAP
jgi:hypothetical protein